MPVIATDTLVSPLARCPLRLDSGVGDKPGRATPCVLDIDLIAGLEFALFGPEIWREVLADDLEHFDIRRARILSF
jgi:hypothetical protein